MTTNPNSKRTVTLSGEQGQFVNDMLLSGAYASEADMIEDALDLIAERHIGHANLETRLKQAYAEGMSSGEGRVVTAAELLAEFKSAG